MTPESAEFFYTCVSAMNLILSVALYQMTDEVYTENCYYDYGYYYLEDSNELMDLAGYETDAWDHPHLQQDQQGDSYYYYNCDEQHLYPAVRTLFFVFHTLTNGLVLATYDLQKYLESDFLRGTFEWTQRASMTGPYLVYWLIFAGFSLHAFTANDLSDEQGLLWYAYGVQAVVFSAMQLVTNHYIDFGRDRQVMDKEGEEMNGQGKEGSGDFGERSD